MKKRKWKYFKINLFVNDNGREKPSKCVAEQRELARKRTQSGLILTQKT